jgi:chloramphenicol O-acetyltransferase type A
MYKTIDIENLPRKNQFKFFKNYDNPFFNICAEIDVTKLLEFTKRNSKSFFISSLYLSLKAANEIEEFRYRLRENQLIVHDEIHAGSTVLNKNNTFSFCYFSYKNNFSEFENNAKLKLEDLAESKGELEARDHEDNMIHYSVIPWISFYSISHPRRFGTEDSIPKIVFGKYYKNNDNIKMPISIEVHHSLMDGYHIGKYLEYMQELLNHPEKYL